MSTFDQMRKKTLTICKEIAQITGLKKSLVMNVIHYAKSLPRPGNPDCIDELIFTAQLARRFGITSEFHIQLIYEAIKDKVLKYVRLEDYVKMVCTFYSNNLALKIDFVFSIYDFSCDGQIQTHEMHKLLKSAIVSVEDEEPEDELRELIDIVIGLMDTDHDGKISIQEFRDYVRNDILYIQLLGQVLPLEHVIEEFMEKLSLLTTDEAVALFRDERSICLFEPIQKTALNELYPFPLEMP